MISKSFVQNIEKEDLKDYRDLRGLYVMNCDLESIPGDLFCYTPRLEAVSFLENKIKFIDPKFLDSLPNLKSLDLRKNSIIDDKFKLGNTVTLDEIKKKIASRCEISCHELAETNGVPRKNQGKT